MLSRISNGGIVDKQFKENQEKELIWIPECGMGYLAVDQPRIDYWDQYVEKGESPIAAALNDFRINLVNKHTEGPVLDIGIGNGKFIENRKHRTFGFDVDPKSIEWLKKKKIFVDPYKSEDITAMCFFDSLEHISEPHKLLEKIMPGGYLFISIPIFRNAEHAIYSKHFRPNEHIWYFTWAGLVKWVIKYKYDFVASSEQESKLGREDIGTFVFRRKKLCK